MGGDNELQIFCEQKLQAQQAADSVIAEVRRIEQKYSRYRKDSVISLINASAGKEAVVLDSETASLLNYADACFRQSGGLFDISSGVLRRAWNFGKKILPPVEEINKLLPMIGWGKVSWKSPKLFLPQEGMELDFGGIGKEYAVDRAAAILKEKGLVHSLINLAGDIRVSGSRSNDSPWSIGITDSRDGVRILGAVEMRSGAIATSGDYERVIEIAGKRYSHILNPKTGWPTEGLQSVSVIADSCLVAGSITTTAMLRGKNGEAYLREMGVPYVLVTSGGRISYSNSLAKFFQGIDQSTAWTNLHFSEQLKQRKQCYKG